MTPEQIQETLNAATQSLDAVNRNMIAFLLVIILVVIVGGVVIAYVVAKTLDKVSDRTASTQKQDNDIQIKTIELAANVFGSVNRLSTAIEGDVQGREKLQGSLEKQISTMEAFVRENRDQNNMLSETVAQLSTRVHNHTAVVQNVKESVEALEVAVRDLSKTAGVDDASMQRFTDKIEQAKNEILAAMMRSPAVEATP